MDLWQYNLTSISTRPTFYVKSDDKSCIIMLKVKYDDLFRIYSRFSGTATFTPSRWAHRHFEKFMLTHCLSDRIWRANL